MAQYVVRRFLWMIPTVFLISIISFVVIELPPGDFLSSYLIALQAGGADVDQSMIAALEKQYGLDRPLHIRYVRWMQNAFRGNLGQSWSYNRPVSGLILERLPMTMVVAFGALLVMYAIAIPVGIYSAFRQYSVADHAITTVGFLGLSIPNFLLALVLMFVFHQVFGVSIGGLFSPEFRNAPWSVARVWDLFQHLWAPIIVIGTAGTAGLIRLQRAMTLDELGKDYVRTARAKGLSTWRVRLHVVRVSINPVLSMVGWQLPQIFSGDAIVAVVLGLPTVGALLLHSLLTQDMYLAGSLILILSILTVIGTLLSDLLLAWSDPRIRFE
jgi:peptide/nickel transport system permease protein